MTYDVFKMNHYGSSEHGKKTKFILAIRLSITHVAVQYSYSSSIEQILILHYFVSNTMQKHYLYDASCCHYWSSKHDDFHFEANV